jgi:hypothetical protein
MFIVRMHFGAYHRDVSDRLHHFQVCFQQFSRLGSSLQFELFETADEAVSLMYEIETASRMKHTAVVNNTNLGCETTAEIIAESKDFADEVAAKTGLPLAFTTCPEDLCESPETSDILPIKVFVKPLWEI